VQFRNFDDQEGWNWMICQSDSVIFFENDAQKLFDRGEPIYIGGYDYDGQDDDERELKEECVLHLSNWCNKHRCMKRIRCHKCYFFLCATCEGKTAEEGARIKMSDEAIVKKLNLPPSCSGHVQSSCQLHSGRGKWWFKCTACTGFICAECEALVDEEDALRALFSHRIPRGSSESRMEPNFFNRLNHSHRLWKRQINLAHDEEMKKKDVLKINQVDGADDIEDVSVKGKETVDVDDDNDAVDVDDDADGGNIGEKVKKNKDLERMEKKENALRILYPIDLDTDLAEKITNRKMSRSRYFHRNRNDVSTGLLAGLAQQFKTTDNGVTFHFDQLVIARSYYKDGNTKTKSYFLLDMPITAMAGLVESILALGLYDQGLRKNLVGVFRTMNLKELIDHYMDLGELADKSERSTETALALKKKENIKQQREKLRQQQQKEEEEEEEEMNKRKTRKRRRFSSPSWSDSPNGFE
jgi:hypothetical protein